MSPEELDAIEKRANAASKGPWRYRTDERGAWQFDAKNAGRPVMSNLTTVKGLRPIDDDAAFIAAARSDVPYLVAEVRRLREEIEAARVYDKPPDAGD